MKFFATATVLALPLLAVATPTAELLRRDQCNTGTINCCNSTVTSNSAEAGLLAGLLGIVLGPITGLLGLGCSPISVVGVGSGSACNASPVCCTNNEVGGLIGIGCVPISL